VKIDAIRSVAAMKREAASGKELECYKKLLDSSHNETLDILNEYNGVERVKELLEKEYSTDDILSTFEGAVLTLPILEQMLPPDQNNSRFQIISFAGPAVRYNASQIISFPLDACVVNHAGSAAADEKKADADEERKDIANIEDVRSVVKKLADRYKLYSTLPQSVGADY